MSGPTRCAGTSTSPRGLAMAEAVDDGPGRRTWAKPRPTRSSRRPRAGPSTSGRPFADALAQDPRITQLLDRDAIEDALRPEDYLGVPAQFVGRVLARATALARTTAMTDVQTTTSAGFAWRVGRPAGRARRCCCSDSLGTTSDIWQPQLAAVRARAAASSALDTRGHGQSAAPAGEYTLDDARRRRAGRARRGRRRTGRTSAACRSAA